MFLPRQLDDHLISSYREIGENQLGIGKITDIDTTVATVISRAIVVGHKASRIVEADVGREDREVRHLRLIEVGVAIRDLGLYSERAGWRVLVDPLADPLVVRHATRPRLNGADELGVSEEIDARNVADRRRPASPHLVNDSDRPALAPARAEASDDLGVRLRVRCNHGPSLGPGDAVSHKAVQLLVFNHSRLGTRSVTAVGSGASTGDASD